MITNAVCRIIRTLEDGTYSAVGEYPCMWQDTEAYENKKYGEERADKAAIFIPDISADVLKGNYITRDALSGNLDVSGMLVVSSVSRRDYGSPDMRHLEVGAK